MNLFLMVPMSSLPMWSDDFLCVLFHPVSGATHMFSKWALIALNFVAEGQDTRGLLVASLEALASDAQVEVNSEFFVNLIEELIRYDFLMEGSTA